MTSLRAIIYCRVSSKEQTFNLSLPVQEDQCRAFCSLNGWEVDRVFLERGESAKTADRTELQAALTYLREQNKRSEKVHVFVVTNVDRFARDAFDHAIVRRHLAGLGVTLRAVSQPIDETPAGKFMEGIFAALSQLDNEVRGSRTKAGMQEALRRGQWVWRPPLGYLPDGKSMQLDPERAPLVRLGFERFATGLYTRVQVLEILMAQGLRTLRGGELTPQKWGEMLSNRLYIARISQPTWDIDTAGNWPPLVDEDTFWRCQSLLRTDGLVVPKERNNPDFPLREASWPAPTAELLSPAPGRKAGIGATPTTIARRKPTAAGRTSRGKSWKPSSWASWSSSVRAPSSWPSSVGSSWTSGTRGSRTSKPRGSPPSARSPS